MPEGAKSYIDIIANHTNTKLSDESSDMISVVVDEATTVLIALPSINKDEAISKAKIELQEVEKRILSLEAQIAKMEGKAPAQVIEDRRKSLSDAMAKKSQLTEIIGG